MRLTFAGMLVPGAGETTSFGELGQLGLGQTG
jgi:hypothetical protein